MRPELSVVGVYAGSTPDDVRIALEELGSDGSTALLQEYQAVDSRGASWASHILRFIVIDYNKSR